MTPVVVEDGRDAVRVGLVESMTFPVPIVGRFPNIFPLLYRTYPDVLLDTGVVPTARLVGIAVIVQFPPRVQVWLLTVIEALTRSEFVTRPVALKNEFTDKPEINGAEDRTTFPVPVVDVVPNNPPLVLVTIPDEVKPLSVMLVTPINVPFTFRFPVIVPPVRGRYPAVLPLQGFVGNAAVIWELISSVPPPPVTATATLNPPDV